jgi:Tol biopolymer transport system component
MCRHTPRRHDAHPRGSPDEPVAKKSTGTPTLSPTTSSPLPTPIPTPTPDAILAFASGKDGDSLTVLDSYGQGVTLVKGSGTSLTDVCWSPDGVRIAYVKATSPTSLANELTVYEVASGTSSAVSFGEAAPQMVRNYTWTSPTEIVAAAYPKARKSIKANSDIYRCDLAAGTAEPLADSSGKALKGMNVSASGDGSLLAYNSLTSATAGQATETLELLDLSSGSLKPLAGAKTDMSTEGMNFDHIEISPDGKHIYTNQMSIGPGFTVRIFGANGKLEAQRAGFSWPGHAAWSPEGTDKVVFGSVVPEGDEFSGPAPPKKPVQIYVWNPKSSKADGFALLYAQKTGPLQDFAWSPDGTWIAYSVVNSRPGSLFEDLYLVTKKGDRAFRLMKDAGYPSWAVALVPQLYVAPSPTPTPGPSE